MYTLLLSSMITMIEMTWNVSRTAAYHPAVLESLQSSRHTKKTQGFSPNTSK